MKKFIALALVLVMAVSMVACGNNDTTNDTTANNTTAAPETTVAPETNAPETTEGAVTSDSVTTNVLANIWAATPEDNKFPIMGGNAEAASWEGPAIWDKAYIENLPYTLYIPAEQLGSIEEVSTMVHAMMANNFSGGALKLVEGTDTAAYAQMIRDTLQSTAFICGQPEKLLVAEVDGCIVMAFGAGDILDSFVTNMTAAYADAKILFNEGFAG